MSEQNPEVNGEFSNDLKLWIDEVAEISPETMASLFEGAEQMRQKIGRMGFCEFIGGRQGGNVLPWLVDQPARNNPPCARPPADWNDEEVRRRLGETYSPMEDTEGKPLLIESYRVKYGAKILGPDQDLAEFYEVLSKNSQGEVFPKAGLSVGMVYLKC